jgi:YebC/PmpR family DNA-binding regulatory protein
MGRAYEVRKAAMAKTNAAKTKVYSKFGKEIYLAAKGGVPDPDMNSSLRRIIEKAKKEQVPADIIKRAIDKAKSGGGEDYSAVTYEGFGPGASTVIVECLTDNVNRSVSEVRAAFSKNKSKLGISGSVSHGYERMAIVALEGVSEDEVIEAMINNDVDVKNIESEEGHVYVYGEPHDADKMKDALTSVKPDISFEVDEITYLPSEYVNLEGEEKDYFNRLLQMLDEIDDVQNVYHNVQES